MKVITSNPRHLASHPFSGLTNDFLENTGLHKWFDEDLFKFNVPTHAPVNIYENKESYQLDLAAPGWEKKDFQIKVEGKTLFISTEKKEEKTSDSDKQLRREFSLKSFKRAFTLDDSIESGKVNARYENGILQVTLPKKQESIEPTKEITVE